MQLLDLAAGLFLLAAVLMLWRRELAAMIRLFAVQGVALAGCRRRSPCTKRSRRAGCGRRRASLVLRAGVLPSLLRRALADRRAASAGDPAAGQRRRLAAGRRRADPARLRRRPPTGRAGARHRPPQAMPVGIAVVLIGFFVLATRRRALSQVVGFLLLDNGITAVAFLATAGVPLIVELGVSLDLLLVVLVLQILTGRLRAAFGATDLDELRELHD